MKKLFKRIAPLLLALVMVLGSCLTVSAAESFQKAKAEVVYDALVDHLKDLGVESKYKYFLINFDNSYGVYYSAIAFDKPVYRVASGRVAYSESFSCIVSTNHNGSTPAFYSFDCSSDSGLSSGYFNGLVKSSYDLYSDSSGTNLFLSADTDFFPIPPTPAPPLVGAVQGAAPEEALKEVILLIPLSILFLAGCLGLRKGLRLLLTLLHRA